MHDLFEPNIGSTNYFRLEMVNGTTRYQARTQDAGVLAIGSAVGSGAEMLCSNTTASVALPFEMNGELSLVNSTLTLERPADIKGKITINNSTLEILQAAQLTGEVVVDLSNLPADGIVIKGNNLLSLYAPSLRFIGEPPEEAKRFTIMTGLNGTFANISGLPTNYSAVQRDDEIIINWSLPRTIFLVK